MEADLRIGFAINSESPLLMSRDDIDWADYIMERRIQLKEKGDKDNRAGDERSPPEFWKGTLYHDNNHICMMSDNLSQCLTEAGAKIHLKGKETYKRLIKAGILFDTEFLEFRTNEVEIKWNDILKINGTYREQADAVKSLGFELYAKRARVGKTKHIRIRPRFNKWSISGEATVIDDRLTLSMLSKIFTIAGVRCGIGNWRPSCMSPGQFGRFTAVVKKIV